MIGVRPHLVAVFSLGLFPARRLESEMFLKPDGGLAGYRNSMNRFLLMPKPKPEFKMAQPLPPLLGIPRGRNRSPRAPEAAAFCLDPTDSPGLFRPPTSESLTASDRTMAS